jgi:hypothetical protein
MRSNYFDFFLLSRLFNGRHGWKKITKKLQRTALKWKKKKHMHTGKEVEAYVVEKGRFELGQ